MSSHVRHLLQRLASPLRNFRSLSGSALHNHEPIKRGQIVRQTSINGADQEKWARLSENAPAAEQSPTLSKDPPQADFLLQIPQEFSHFAPGLPTVSVSAGASRAAEQDAGDLLDKEDGILVTRYLSLPRKSGTVLTGFRGSGAGDSKLICATPHTSSQSLSPLHAETCLHEATGEVNQLPPHEKELLRNTQNGCSHYIASSQDAFSPDCPDCIENFSDAQNCSDIKGERAKNHGGNMECYTGSLDHGDSSSANRRIRFSMHRDVAQTPSGRLLDALPAAARKAFAPQKTSKTDLSYVAIRRWENASRRHKSWQGLQTVKQNINSASRLHPPIKHTSLSAILARYLAERVLSKARALLKLHEPETLSYLRSKGYGADDVVAWSRIISSSNADQAVTRFIAAAEEASSAVRPPLPTFLLMFIMRAGSLRAASLRLLINYVRTRYVDQAPESNPHTYARLIQQQTAMIIIVRLIRHARAVWPNALEEIAFLATKLIGRASDTNVGLGHQQIQAFSHIYNRLLTLFAMPTSLRPIVSAGIQQRSQFCLIREMITFTPHLPVTREGFRALAKVQLAHRKTDPERKWATSKALSWPPWKEELLGIEAESEDLGRHSRAMEVLSRMTEAGYSHWNWEQTARVLAGWDTDRSPTIQTRTLMQQSGILRSSDVKLEARRSKSDIDRIWAARILATRTVKEAWACFTSYDKFSKGTHTYEPYKAMFSRLLHAGKRNVDQEIGTTSVLPGDGKETWPEPTSPHDFIYVPSDPPSVDEFFDMMREKGLSPRKHLLRDLLDHSETLVQAVEYVNASALLQSEKDALLGTTEIDAVQLRITINNSVPDFVVAAFVRLLCRTQLTPEIDFVVPKASVSQKTVAKGIVRTRDPFYYAQKMVLALQPSYRPTWYALFHGLNRRMSTSQPQDLFRLWTLLLKQLRDMDALGIELDFGAFRDIGEILEELLLTNNHVIFRKEQEFSDHLKLRCVSLCKRIFNAMAYGGSINSKNDIAQSPTWLPLNRPAPSTQFPRQIQTLLTDIPNPATLHRTIRILGISQDSSSILTLLRWMHLFSPELTSISSDLANSKKLIRHTLTASRYYLEKCWREEDFDNHATLRGVWEPGQRELVEEAKSFVEEMEEVWGGWATEEELRRYHFGDRRKAGRLRRSLGLGGSSCAP